MAPTLLAEASALRAAREAIERAREAGTAFAHATAQECALLRQKAGRKAEAIRRLMADPTGNGLTGRAHSASSAEAVVETDAAYAGFLQQSCTATVGVILARTECVAARLEAQLALALVLDDQEEEQ
jgi:hypothetical protein